MKIRSVSHIGVTVSDFEAAVRWYHTYFGFVLISEKRLGKEEVEALWPLYQVKDSHVRLGFLRAPKGQVIEIFEFSNKTSTTHEIWNAPSITHFTLDVKHLHKWVKAYEHHLNFLIKPQNTDGNEWVFLRDPDGNLIELIDLKMNYHVIRLIGGLAGAVMKKTQFKSYYAEPER